MTEAELIVLLADAEGEANLLNAAAYQSNLAVEAAEEVYRAQVASARATVDVATNAAAAAARALGEAQTRVANLKNQLRKARGQFAEGI